jgi:hypothetical protein
MVTLRSVTRAVLAFWENGRRIERVGYTVGALLLFSGLVHLGILVTSGGSWEGPLSFRKPMTFGLSFGLTLITIVWVSFWVRLADRSRTALLGVFMIASVLETLLVSLQTWRGAPSHFNVETAFDGAVARGLAMGGAVLVAVIGTLTIAAFRAQPDVPLSLRIAIRIGFIALCASMVVGALMIARGMSLVSAGEPRAAYSMGGAFKPIHAVTMHAILVLPVFAWLLSFTTWTERRQVRLILLGAAGYLVLAGIVIVANVGGLF